VLVRKTHAQELILVFIVQVVLRCECGMRTPAPPRFAAIISAASVALFP
jgi:hypothetical protein